jgi:hypothetical protein
LIHSHLPQSVRHLRSGLPFLFRDGMGVIVQRGPNVGVAQATLDEVQVWRIVLLRPADPHA